MGPKETQQMYIRTCIDRSAIVALSAEPPGVNELCVYGDKTCPRSVQSTESSVSAPGTVREPFEPY
jgi:hypothetical protein